MKRKPWDVVLIDYIMATVIVVYVVYFINGELKTDWRVTRSFIAYLWGAGA